MKAIFSYCGDVVNKVKATRKQEETIPFAQAENGNGSGQCDNDVMKSGFANSFNPKRRRDTVSGLEKSTISAWDAGWNVSNAIQGMFVLGLPLAIRYGGYVGLFMIALAAVLCYYTGKILINCLYEKKNGERIRVRNSYSDIAVRCWGSIGGHLVYVSQLIELLMTCVLYILVSGNLMKNSFPDLLVTEATWSILASIVLFFCIFLRDLKDVSRLSMGCSTAQFVVIGVTIFYCLTNIKHWHWSKLTFNVNAKQFPISIGVIVFSYTSQIFLPSLEGSMANQGEFRRMLCWSYVASCVTKEMFALSCFLMWADDIKEMATDNLPFFWRATMNIILVVKALLSYPLPYYQSIEIIEQKLFTNAPAGIGSVLQTERHTYKRFSEDSQSSVQATSFTEITPITREIESGEVNLETNEKDTLVTLNGKSSNFSGCPTCYTPEGRIQHWALALRALLVFGTLLMAIYIPHFALLMGFTGSLTGTLLAFCMPCAFHLQLKHKDLSWSEILFNVAVLLFGIFCAFTGLYYSIIGFYEAFHPSQWSNNITLPLLGNISNDNNDENSWSFDFPKKSRYVN